MKLNNVNAEIFIPDNKPVEEALSRITHMGIAAHQDDLEIMAYDGILKCFGSEKNWFLGITVTNGAGSPRDGLYANYTDEDMQKVRRVEQKKAAMVGEYGAMVFLDYSSSTAKDPKNQNALADLKTLFALAKPSVVYTHNLADKHDTHVAVALKTIHALRELPEDIKPRQVYGCEVWRDFDWMADRDKIALDVSAHENLAAALLGVYDSQIAGGKRYDIATMGRRRANATYHASHGVDTSSYLIYAMDLTPLIKDPKLDIKAYIREFIDRFCKEVEEKIEKLGY
jgi:LmbE family N-acetylglucosaminyl deacetylase